MGILKMTKSRIALSAVALILGAFTAKAEWTFGLIPQNVIHPSKSDLVLRQYNAFTPLCYSGVPVQWPNPEPSARRFSRFGLFGYTGGCGTTGCNTCGNSQFTIPGAEGEVITEGEIIDGAIRPGMKIRGMMGR